MPDIILDEELCSDCVFQTCDIGKCSAHSEIQALSSQLLQLWKAYQAEVITQEEYQVAVDAIKDICNELEFE